MLFSCKRLLVSHFHFLRIFFSACDQKVNCATFAICTSVNIKNVAYPLIKSDLVCMNKNFMVQMYIMLIGSLDR